MFTKVDELIWTDEKYKRLSDDGKFLFLYVLSCPHRNILGFYFLPIPYGAFDLAWESERFTKGLKELLDKGFINYNFNTNIIFIKNFLKYNPLENPNQVKGAMKALDILPANGIDAELVEYLETVDKPFIKPLIELLRERLGKHVDVYVDVEVEVDEDEETQQSCSDDLPANSDIEFNEESTEIQLVRFMIDEMLRVKSDSKVPSKEIKDLQRWAKQIDYLIRLDNRTPKIIAELFRWSQEDTFWCANIRSPQKLREKWDTLELQRNRQSKPKSNKNLSTLEEMHRKALAEEEGN